RAVLLTTSLIKRPARSKGRHSEERSDEESLFDVSYSHPPLQPDNLSRSLPRYMYASRQTPPFRVSYTQLIEALFFPARKSRAQPILCTAQLHPPTQPWRIVSP